MFNPKTVKNATIQCNYGTFHDDITHLKVDVEGGFIVVFGYAVRSKINVVMSVNDPQVWNPDAGENITHLSQFVESN